MKTVALYRDVSIGLHLTKNFLLRLRKYPLSKKQNIQLCPAHFDGIPEQVPIIAIPVRWKKRGCMSCRLFTLHVCIAISSCPLPLLVRDFLMSLSLSRRTFLEGKKLCKRHESQAYTLFKWWKNINYFLSNKDMKIIIVNKV